MCACVLFSCKTKHSTPMGRCDDAAVAFLKKKCLRKFRLHTIFLSVFDLKPRTSTTTFCSQAFHAVVYMKISDGATIASGLFRLPRDMPERGKPLGAFALTRAPTLLLTAVISPYLISHHTLSLASTQPCTAALSPLRPSSPPLSSFLPLARPPRRPSLTSSPLLVSVFWVPT